MVNMNTVHHLIDDVHQTIREYSTRLRENENNTQQRCHASESFMMLLVNGLIT